MLSPEDMKKGERQAEMLKKYFEEQGWSHSDVVAGIGWFTEITLLLMFNQIPLRASKMPEVLRALANILEANKEEFNE